MSAAMPSTARQQYPAARTSRLPPLGQRPRRRILVHPLTAICAVQAALSLSLVWSNTAFADEAQYLSSGQLEWAHWLHGASCPAISPEELFWVARHLPASRRLGQQHRRPCRSKDLVTAIHAWHDNPALSHGVATTGPHSGHHRRCSLGAERAGHTPGICHFRSVVSAADGTLGLADRAGRLPLPSRCVRGRGGGRPCSRQRDGILGDHHRPCSYRLRIPRVVAPHA